MRQTSGYFLRTLVGTAAFALALTAAWAQSPASDGRAQAGDPARWYQEDMTQHARFLTLKKEADAAYREGLAECRKITHATRSACVQEARRLYEQDMLEARQQTQTPRH